MDKNYTLVIILLYCALFCNTQALGQEKVADSIQLHNTTVNMAGMFNKAIIEQSRIYNGPAFIPYNLITKTNANFQDTTAFINGTVNYDGVVYTNVPLVYNMHKDVLVSRLYNGVSQYSLLTDKVYEFDLLGHHFIRLQPDSLNSQMAAGFYDELYNNKLQVLVRRVKKLEEESGTMTIGSLFVKKTDYYLKKGTKYYKVDGEGKFYDVLNDKKKELKQYLKDNKIRFKDNPENVMAVLAAYYDHLTN